LTTKQILEFEPNTSEKRKENSQGISISSGTNRRYIDESWPTIAGLGLAEFYEAINGKIKRFGQGNVGTYLGDVCVSFSSWCPCLVFFCQTKVSKHSINFMQIGLRKL